MVGTKELTTKVRTYMRRTKMPRYRKLSVTADEMRDLARLPKELEGISSIIEKEADKGEAGVWLKVSKEAERAIVESDFETSLSADRPGFTWIWWG